MSTQIFSVWVEDKIHRWTNRRYGASTTYLQSTDNPEPLTWRQAKDLADDIGCMNARVRELLSDKSPGAFFDQDPGTCPQCGGMH
jgi:hypothetical protein